jgi:hypothetical protein
MRPEQIKRLPDEAAEKCGRRAREIIEEFPLTKWSASRSPHGSPCIRRTPLWEKLLHPYGGSSDTRPVVAPAILDEVWPPGLVA